MEIDTTVPETYISSKFCVPPPDDPYVADLLQVADTKIAQLEAEVSQLEDEKEILDRKLKNFRQQVSLTTHLCHYFNERNLHLLDYIWILHILHFKYCVWFSYRNVLIRKHEFSFIFKPELVSVVFWFMLH